MANGSCENDSDDDFKFVIESSDGGITLETKLVPERRVERCLLTWSIQKFHLLPQDNEKFVSSPSFSLHKLPTTWFIHFYPNAAVDKKCTKLSLLRCNNHGPDVVAVTYRIGIGTPHTIWLKERRKILFRQGSVDFVESENVIYNELLKDDVLTLLCEMYVFELEDAEISQPNLCRESSDLTKLSQNLYHLLQNPVASDVVVKINDLVISAHKAVISTRSSVFAHMISESSSLDLLDVDYDHIYNVILYIYSGSFSFIVSQGNICIGLYECADRYSINGLKQLLTPTKINISSSLDKVRLNFTWTFERFSTNEFKKGARITSGPLSSGAQTAARWCIDIFPAGYTTNNVEIYARTFKRPEALDVNVSISILNENMEELLVRHTYKTLQPLPIVYGFPDFISQGQLTKESKFLANDKLSVNCKIVSTVHKTFFGKTSLFSCSSIAKLACLKYLSEDFGQLLQSKKFSDATLVLNDEIIHVHKCILSARSSTFASLLKTNKECIVGITNIAPDVLEAMIFYAYTGKLKYDFSIAAIDLYKAAHTYEMTTLVNTCSSLLESELDVKCICDLIMLSRKYKDKILMSICLRFFKQNDKQILSSDEWKSFMKTKANFGLKLLQWLSKIRDKDLHRSV